MEEEGRDRERQVRPKKQPPCVSLSQGQFGGLDRDGQCGLLEDIFAYIVEVACFPSSSKQCQGPDALPGPFPLLTVPPPV